MSHGRSHEKLKKILHEAMTKIIDNKNKTKVDMFSK